jgi:hypothetical protein
MLKHFNALCHWCGRVKEYKIGKYKMDELEEESHLQLTWNIKIEI